MRARSLAVDLLVLFLFAGACGGDDTTADGDLKLSCSKTTNGCVCSAFSEGSGDGDISDCSPSAFPGTLCCADKKWPSSPPTTSCVCLTNDDGTTPASCADVAFAGSTYPSQIDACDLDHSGS